MSTIRAAGRGNGQLPALVCLLLGGALAPARGADGPPRLADVLGGLERVRRLEFVQMATALAGGSDMSRPGDGWFKPSQSRYTWKWLAARYDKDRDGKVTEKELGAPAELFARLDRNGDGSVTEGDLDWSGSSLASMTFMGKFMPAIQTFQRNDRDSNGKVSRAEWDKLFDQLAKGKDFLIPEDLQELLSPPRPAGGGKPPPGMMPSRWVLLKGLLNGELGSAHEGPDLNGDAPSFTLPTPDGAMEITYAPTRTRKPMVLIFGSFT